MCPFLLELEELFQDVTFTLTWNKFFITFKEKKKQFFLKMDNRTCSSVSTDQLPSWVSSLGKMALNFSHTGNYWWVNPQEIWRKGDIKLWKPELPMPERLGQKSLWKQILPGVSSIFMLLLCSGQRDHERTPWVFYFKSYRSEQDLEEDES